MDRSRNLQFFADLWLARRPHFWRKRLCAFVADPWQSRSFGKPLSGRLACDDCLLFAVLGHGRTFHRIPMVRRLDRLDEKLANRAVHLADNDCVLLCRLRVGDRRIGPQILQLDLSGYCGVWALPLDEASGVCFKSNIVLADYRAIRSAARLGFRISAVPCAIAFVLDLLFSGKI